MSKLKYQVLMIVMLNLFVLTFYRPVLFVAFVLWSVGYVWLVQKRAATTGQLREGRVARVAGLVGGVGLQGTAINIQMDIFPKYVAPIFGILGVVGFGIAMLFAVSLIGGWYPPKSSPQP
jgi:hypothetical protein